jgi:hypothetical protein
METTIAKNGAAAIIDKFTRFSRRREGRAGCRQPQKGKRRAGQASRSNRGQLGNDSAGMKSIKRIGFFHFGSDEKTDPVGSLEIEIAKLSEPELKDSMIVLPEALNARKGYYRPTPELDPKACLRLQVGRLVRPPTPISGSCNPRR